MNDLFQAEIRSGAVLSQKIRPLFVTICSGKGGVGKSVVCANLGIALAAKGFRTVVWDADASFPNQHILFGIEPPLRIHDVYSGKVSVQSALFSILENLFMLAGKTGLGSFVVSPAHLVSVRSELLIMPIDIVLIDAAAGSSDDILQCCASSDLTLIMATDEPTAIIDAYGMIKILQRYVATHSIALLVNNVIDAEDAEEISKKMNLATEKFLNLHIPMAGFIPYDRAVRTSIVEQKPLLYSQPRAEASLAISTVAEVIARAIRNQQEVI